jgi:hypothetical protein
VGHELSGEQHEFGEHIFSKLEISSRVQLTLLLRDRAACRGATGMVGGCNEGYSCAQQNGR